MDVARYAIARPVNTWLLILVCIIGGAVGLNNIGRLEDPAFTIKQVRIVTAYPGASALKVEQQVTEVVESTLQQLPQLYRLTSISKPGMSEITLEIQHHFDAAALPQIWDEVRKRLRDMHAQLPVGAMAPRVYDDFGEVFGLYYAMRAEGFGAREVREFTRLIRQELLTLPGVAKVEIGGLVQEQIVAEMDPYQIAGLGLSFPDVVALLRENLRNVNGGRILMDGKRIRVPVDNGKERIRELGNLTLVVPGSDVSIRIKDFIQLSLAPVEIPSQLIRYQGEDAVTLAIAARQDVNVVEVGKAVNAYLTALERRLPAGILFDPIYDQARVVEQAVDGFILNLQLSVLVVTLTLCLFMGWRSGVVVGTVLLATVMGTILIMWLAGLQLQRISLGAMVIAMGMLVDNAIVVADGMLMRMRQRIDAREAASYIVRRTQWPLLGATVIGIAAFSGIGLSDDQTGEFLFSLFAVIMISLLLSWVLAVSVAPLLGAWLFKPAKESARTGPGSLTKGYRALLTLALGHRWLTLGALLAITVLAFGSFSMLKQGFFPASNTPIFFLHYWGPQDRDIRTTKEQVAAVERALLANKDIQSVTSFIGQGAQRFTLTYGPQSPNESYALLLVRARDADHIPRLARELPATLGRLNPDGRVFEELIKFGPSKGAALEARFSGPNAEVLRDLADQAMAILNDSGGIRNIRHDWREKGLVLDTHFDDYNAGIAGVSRADYAAAVQFATSGLRLGQLQDSDYVYPIVAKMPDQGDSPLAALQNSQVWSAQQRRYVPFRQVSRDVSLASEEVLIKRRNRLRSISVLAEPGQQETAAAALARVRPAIEALHLPEGYRLQWGGEHEASGDAERALGKNLPAGFLVMLLITILLFGRVRQPLIIWLILPMALVGVVAALLLSDMAFGFMALLGFLSLFGMLIKNAIVLIEEIDLLRQEGQGLNAAIMAAAQSRLQPVSLAAITTILGMAPLLADKFFADMAVTIMGGLSFATLLTLIAVPVLYSLLFSVGHSNKRGVP